MNSIQSINSDSIINTNKLNTSNGQYYIIKNFGSYNPNVMVSWYIQHEQKIEEKDVTSKIEEYLYKENTPQKTAQELFDRSVETYEELMCDKYQHRNLRYIDVSKKIQNSLSLSMDNIEFSNLISKIIDDYIEMGIMGEKYKPEIAADTFVSDLKDELKSLIIYWMMSSKYHYFNTSKDTELKRIDSDPNRDFAKIIFGRMYQLFLEFRKLEKKDEFKGMDGFFLSLDYSDGWMTQGPIILHCLLVFMQSSIKYAKMDFINEKTVENHFSQSLQP